MKTTEHILIENDCYQPSIEKVEGRIISIDVQKFKRAMVEYAIVALSEYYHRTCKELEDDNEQTFSAHGMYKLIEELK